MVKARAEYSRRGWRFYRQLRLALKNTRIETQPTLARGLLPERGNNTRRGAKMKDKQETLKALKETGVNGSDSRRQGRRPCGCDPRVTLRRGEVH